MGLLNLYFKCHNNLAIREETIGTKTVRRKARDRLKPISKLKAFGSKLFHPARQF